MLAFVYHYHFKYSDTHHYNVKNFHIYDKYSSTTNYYGFCQDIWNKILIERLQIYTRWVCLSGIGIHSERFSSANAYWIGLTGLSTANMNAAFADIANTGATLVRTWGFNDVTSPSGDYYQLWTNGIATVNTGATGLQNFGTTPKCVFQRT